MKKNTCPVCSHHDFGQSVCQQGYGWDICGNCSTWLLVSPLKNIPYPDEYYGRTSGKFHGAAQRSRLYFHRGRVANVKKYLPNNSDAIYDIGCGDGIFLRYAEQFGIKGQGFEPELFPRKQAEHLLKCSIDSELFQFQKEKKFSGITCWQVIEHLHDPGGFLQSCYEHLHQEGLLAISTVNRNSIQASTFGPKWLHLDPPRHLWVAPMSEVIRLLNRNGFEIIKIRYNTLEFGPVGWVDSLINLIDPERDRLLRCLKHGCRDFYDWTTWVASILFIPLAIFLSLIEAGVDRPATFEIYARKSGSPRRAQGG